MSPLDIVLIPSSVRVHEFPSGSLAEADPSRALWPRLYDYVIDTLDYL